MGFEVSISTISAQNEKEVATLKPPPGLFQWKFPIIQNEGNISEPGFMVAESKYILPEFEKKTKSYLKIHREIVDIITNSTSKGLTQSLDEPGAAIGGVRMYTPPPSPRNVETFISQTIDTKFKFDQELEKKFNNCMYSKSPFGAIGSKPQNWFKKPTTGFHEGNLFVDTSHEFGTKQARNQMMSMTEQNQRVLELANSFDSKGNLKIRSPDNFEENGKRSMSFQSFDMLNITETNRKLDDYDVRW